jgi:hypothetical protein
MSKYYLFLFGFLISFFGYSQSAKIVKGIIICDNASVSNAEVINVRTKNVAVTNEFGVFTIAAQRNDLLVIVAKDFFEKKVYLSSALLSQDKISIDVIRKSNELKEVIVKKEKLVTPIEMSEVSRINSYNTTKQANQMGVYTGETIYGMDFVAIGKMIGKLFKKKKKKPVNTINFTEYVSNNIDKSYLLETLKLEDKDYYRFLEFCESDPTVSQLIVEDNQFKIFNFLYNKKEAFDKL